MYFYQKLPIFIAISSLISILNGSKIDKTLTGLVQNDPLLIKTIQEQFLVKPTSSDKDYNFTAHRPEAVSVWAKPDKYSLNTRDGQYGQVLEIAKLFKNKKNGFFIEAGAYDGEIYSNTLKFEMDLNWTGLLVEPNPDVFEALLTKNRKSYAIKTCLSTKPEVTEVSFDMAGIIGGIINGKFKPGGPDEDDREIRRRRKSKNLRDEDLVYTDELKRYGRQTMEMQCLPLTSIIKAMGNPTIDYLSLDIEGAEFPVLQSIAFDEVDISVISIEVNHVGQIFDGRKANLDTLMRRNGYEFYKSVEIDDIWVKQGFLSSIDKEEL